MKQRIFSLLALIALCFVSCDDSSRWPDFDDPQVYFPLHGVSQNTVWALSEGTYTTELTAYCAGLRPANQKLDITVNCAVDPQLIATYNADITQQYSGQVVELPSDCYQLATSTIIPKGKNEASFPIKFNIASIRQKCTDPSKVYVIPVKLTSTSHYSLNSDETFTIALYGVSLKDPSFFFFSNRDGVQIVGRKVITGEASAPDVHQIIAEGVPAGDYTLTVSYDPETLAKMYPKYKVLPENAFKLVSNSVKYNNESKGEVAVEYIPENIGFGETYYLPLTITSASSYIPNEEYKTLLVRVELKNSYEKPYISRMNVASASNSREGAYSVDKTLVSFDKDVVEMQIGTNATIAGAAATGTSTTYNDKYMRVRIIPTENKAHYNIEYILVSDKAKANNSPASLEANPDKESYYNWDEEQFVLNYRWKHSDGLWITVEETLSAK